MRQHELLMRTKRSIPSLNSGDAGFVPSIEWPSYRYYWLSRQSNINRECGTGTICFERGREDPDIPRVED
jgi:hypothetical protein